jgi:hypothetical protein
MEKPGIKINIIRAMERNLFELNIRKPPIFE